MSHRARRSGRNIRQSSRNRASRSVKYSKLPISAGTIDSDDEVMPEELHPNVEVEEQDQASTSSRPYQPSSPTQTQDQPDKSSDRMKVIMAQNRVINSRLISIEEKLDHVHRIVDLSYKSTPVTPTMGPRSGVVNVTRW